MRGVRDIVRDYLVHRGDVGPSAREKMSLELEALVEEAYGLGLRDGAAAGREG